MKKTTAYKFDIAGYSAIGRRANNEDSYSQDTTKAGVLAIVADGVGGCVGGERASAQVVESMNSYLKDCDFDDDELMEAIFRSNLDVLELGDGREANNPKSTLAMLWFCGEQAYAANVGDSRVYQFRGGKIAFQSTDHSVPQLAVKAGLIKLEDIRYHKEKNKITRCIGNEEFSGANIELLDIRPGDRFLICSDGFWEPVWENDMLQAAEHNKTAAQWLEAMNKIAYAKEKDNHTAIAILVAEEDDNV